MFLRSAAGSVCLLALLLVVNACSTAGPATTTTRATIRGTVVDSSAGTTVDSAKAFYRGPNDTLAVTSDGSFELRDVPPGLYLFDIGGYGYHTHRHVSALVEPGDETVDLRVPLLPQTLQMQCQGERTLYHQDMQSFVENDSTALQLRLTDLFARDGEVRVQPVIVSQINAPVFLPENLGSRGHYNVTLSDAEGNPVPYRYPNGPADPEGSHLIYERGDVMVVVPNEAKRLEASQLILEKDIPDGTPLYARMRYTFSLRDTLRPTEQTDFPALNLDSLQTPVYDTLRVAGSVITPDSLVIRRDTTIQRVVGSDTTVTRDGYVLFSTERPTNAASNASEAVSMLYVPDSVKARARRDSLFEMGIDTTTVREEPEIVEDTQPEGPPLRIIRRTDADALRPVLRDTSLLRIFRIGLPRPSAPMPEVRYAPSDTLRTLLPPPELPKRIQQRQIPKDTVVVRVDSTTADSLLSDSLITALPVPDSLRIQPDTTAADTTTLDAPAPDTTGTDTTRIDAAPSDTTAMDPPLDEDGSGEDATDTETDDRPVIAAPDTTAPDTTAVPMAAADDTTAPDTTVTPSDSVRTDSLAGTAPADTLDPTLRTLRLRRDTVVVDTLDGAFLSEPPVGSYYYLPEYLTLGEVRVLIVDSTFTALRAPAVMDTAMVEDLVKLTPERLGQPPQPIITEFVQQIIQRPIGGYRDKYLERWTLLQRENLTDPYCEIFRPSLLTPWRSTTMLQETSAQ